MKLFKNQAGFAPILIVLIVVVVGAAGFAGYKVYNSAKTKPTQNTTTQNTQTEQKKEDVQEDPYEGWQAYDDANLKLKIPGEWTNYKENNQPEWVLFKSPDFKAPTQDGPGPTSEAGYLLEVMVSQSESWESYENDIKTAPEAQEAHGGSYETIKIDGNNAVLSDTKSHGTYWYATTYSKGNTYYFRLNAPDEDKPEVKELFKKILTSVDLK